MSIQKRFMARMKVNQQNGKDWNSRFELKKTDKSKVDHFLFRRGKGRVNLNVRKTEL